MKAGNLVNRAQTLDSRLNIEDRRFPSAPCTAQAEHQRACGPSGRRISARISKLATRARHRRRSRCTEPTADDLDNEAYRADRRRRPDRRPDPHLLDADRQDSHAQPHRGNRGRQADRAQPAALPLRRVGHRLCSASRDRLAGEALPGFAAAGSHRGSVGKQRARKAAHHGCARAESGHFAAVAAPQPGGLPPRFEQDAVAGKAQQGVAQPWQHGGPGRSA